MVQNQVPGWAQWFPFMVAVSLVGGPGGFGFLFGLLMVEEGETGARTALAVTPVRPSVLIVTRTLVATAWMCVSPLTSIYVMNATWQAIDLRFVQWLGVVVPLALLTPALALATPALAGDKVRALAVFKGLSFVTLMPLATFFIRADAPYRRLFLVSPTGWVVESYRAFLDADSAGYWWAAGGAAYAVVLLVGAVQLIRRNVYTLHR